MNCLRSWNGDGYVYSFHSYNKWAKILREILHHRRIGEENSKVLPRSWEAKVTAIQDAKDMKAITLDELIDNLQTYELRRNSQQQKENKTD